MDLHHLLAATIPVLDPDPVAILEIVFLGRFGTDLDQWFGVELAQGLGPAMLGVEELVGAGTVDEVEGILFKELGRDFL